MSADQVEKPSSRNIPPGFQHSLGYKDRVVDLRKQLTDTQRLLTKSLAEFALLAGPEFSPDGLLGGKGYIESIKGIKSELATMLIRLSDFCDTLTDELNSFYQEVEEEEPPILDESKIELIESDPSKVFFERPERIHE